jgi:hypothetical protein
VVLSIQTEDPAVRKSKNFTTFNPFPQFWLEHREASRNWLALGVMLAAWNLTNDDALSEAHRPEPLRRYDYVSVRAVHRMTDEPQGRGASDRHKSVKVL